MAYRRRRRKSSHDDVPGALVLGAIVAYGVYTQMPRRTLTTLVIICAVMLAVTIIAVVVVWSIRTQNEKRKLRALRIADIDAMKWDDFERYVAMLLKARGCTDVRLTEYYDRGVDIVATKDGVRWGVQVKQYSRPVRKDAVEQVYTALSYYHCQRAMVVTNSHFTEQAKEIARANNCALIDRDRLAKWVIAYQSGETPAPASRAVVS